MDVFITDSFELHRFIRKKQKNSIYFTSENDVIPDHYERIILIENQKSKLYKWLYNKYKNKIYYVVIPQYEIVNINNNNVIHHFFHYYDFLKWRDDNFTVFNYRLREHTFMIENIDQLTIKQIVKVVNNEDNEISIHEIKRSHEKLIDIPSFLDGLTFQKRKLLENIDDCESLLKDSQYGIRYIEYKHGFYIHKPPMQFTSIYPIFMRKNSIMTTIPNLPYFSIIKMISALKLKCSNKSFLWNSIVYPLDYNITNSYISKGTFIKHMPTMSFIIQSLPVHVDVHDYEMNVLMKLEKSGIITSYKVLQDDLFEVYTNENIIYDNTSIFKMFELEKKIDFKLEFELNNQVITFDNIDDYLNKWFDYKMRDIQFQKESFIAEMKDEHDYLKKRSLLNNHLALKKINICYLSESETMTKFVNPELLNLPMKEFTNDKIVYIELYKQYLTDQMEIIKHKDVTDIYYDQLVEFEKVYHGIAMPSSKVTLDELIRLHDIKQLSKTTTLDSDEFPPEMMEEKKRPRTPT